MIDRTGQVALVHSTGFWPWLVTAITGSYWNHMVTAINLHECVSAETTGVRRRQLADFRVTAWSMFPESDLARHKVAAFAEAQIGKPYAFFDDFLIGLGIVFRTSAPAWIQSRLRSGRRWECAELADAALQHGGVNVFHDGRPYGAVYPGSFEPVFERFGWLPGEAEELPPWVTGGHRS